MSANTTKLVFYDRRDGSKSAAITTAFDATLLDFGFRASKIMIEVIGAGTCDVGFGEAVVHAELSNTIATGLQPRVYDGLRVGKIYLKGTSTDVKVTAWADGDR